MPDYYYLEYESFALSATAELNGVPLAIDEAGEGLFTQKSLNEWLLPEGNALTVRFCSPATSLAPPLLRVTAFRADPTQEMPVPLERYAKLEWPAPGSPTPTFDIPTIATLPITVPRAPEARLWTEAAPLAALGDADRDRILAIVEELRRAIMEGREEHAVDLLAYKIEDESRALGLDPAEVRRGGIDFYRSLKKRAGRRSAPLVAADAQLTVVAGGRLARVARAGGGAAVVIEDELGVTTVNPFFAKIGGDWKIAR